MHWQRVILGVSIPVALVVAVIAWYRQSIPVPEAFVPAPDEDDAVALYAAHKDEFTELATLAKTPCFGPSADEALTVISHIDQS